MADERPNPTVHDVWALIWATRKHSTPHLLVFLLLVSHGGSSVTAALVR